MPTLQEQIDELKFRVTELELKLKSSTASVDYTLPPGEYTQEEVLRIFPNLTIGTIAKHLKYPRVRRRTYSGKKTWVYLVSPSPSDSL